MHSVSCFARLSSIPPMGKGITSFTRYTQALRKTTTGWMDKIIGKLKNMRNNESTKEDVVYPLKQKTAMAAANAMELKTKSALMEDYGARGKAAKSVYIFFSNSSGPFVHALYAFDLPSCLHDGPLDGPVTPKQTQVSPVLTFSREEYPKEMCCVEMDGVLYFMGGEFVTLHGRNYSRDVYIFDPLSTSLNMRLRRGPKMNTGKRDPIAFVAGKSIYVLCRMAASMEDTLFGEKQSGFEVLTPESCGGSGEWVVLEEPFFFGRVTGHAVIHEKLFLSCEEYLYCFDTVSRKWLTVRQYSFECLMRAHLVGSNLYSCNGSSSVVSYCPFPKSFFPTKDFSLKDRAILSAGVCKHNIPLMASSYSLTHIGGRRFCHVLVGSPSLPDYPNYDDPELCYFSLRIFQAFTDTYVENGRKFFNAKLLHSVRLLNKSTFASSCIIRDCFLLPSCGIKETVKELEFVVPTFTTEDDDDDEGMP